MTMRNKLIEAAARALHPRLFGDDADERHRAASPLRVEIVQAMKLSEATAAVDTVLGLAKQDIDAFLSLCQTSSHD